jgi:hypothetical protein
MSVLAWTVAGFSTQLLKDVAGYEEKVVQSVKNLRSERTPVKMEPITVESEPLVKHMGLFYELVND